LDTGRRVFSVAASAAPGLGVNAPQGNSFSS